MDSSPSADQQGHYKPAPSTPAPAGQSTRAGRRDQTQPGCQDDRDVESQHAGLQQAQQAAGGTAEWGKYVRTFQWLAALCIIILQPAVGGWAHLPAFQYQMGVAALTILLVLMLVGLEWQTKARHVVLPANTLFDVVWIPLALSAGAATAATMDLREPLRLSCLQEGVCHKLIGTTALMFSILFLSMLSMLYNTLAWRKEGVSGRRKIGLAYAQIKDIQKRMVRVIFPRTSGTATASVNPFQAPAATSLIVKEAPWVGVLNLMLRLLETGMAAAAVGCIAQFAGVSTTAHTVLLTTAAVTLGLTCILAVWQAARLLRYKFWRMARYGSTAFLLANTLTDCLLGPVLFATSSAVAAAAMLPCPPGSSAGQHLPPHCLGLAPHQVAAATALSFVLAAVLAVHAFLSLLVQQEWRSTRAFVNRSRSDEPAQPSSSTLQPPLPVSRAAAVTDEADTRSPVDQSSSKGKASLVAAKWAKWGLPAADPGRVPPPAAKTDSTSSAPHGGGTLGVLGAIQQELSVIPPCHPPTAGYAQQESGSGSGKADADQQMLEQSYELHPAIAYPQAAEADSARLLRPQTPNPALQGMKSVGSEI